MSPGFKHALLGPKVEYRFTLCLDILQVTLLWLF